MIVSDFVSRYRDAVRALFESRGRLKQLAELASTPSSPLAGSPDGPFEKDNADITKADLVAAIAAAGQLETALTDFTKSPPEPTATYASLSKML